MGQIRAGVSRVVITPPVGIYLIGMERFENSHGLHDDLYATVVSLSDEEREIVILSADILIFHPDLVSKVRELAQAQTGIPGENMLFCATHCHSGPAPVADRDRPEMEQAYTANLPFLLSGAIRIAHDNLAPARIGFGSGHAAIGMNRRLTRPDGVTVIDANPDRPIDPQVGVIRIDTLEGKPLAVLVNHACHSVVLGAGSNVISRDWPGVMYDLVEQTTGAKCMFLQGAAADINPWPGVPTDRMDLVYRLGTEIGGEVVKVWAGIETQPEIPLAVVSRQVAVPLEPVSEYAGKIPALVEWDTAAGEMSYEEFQAWLYSMGSRPQDTVGEGDHQAVLAEMQAIRIGDLALVAFAAELFVKIGLSIKARSPLRNTLVITYANGAVGYVPLPEDYPHGGYEVSEAFYGYGLPSPIAPDAAGLVENTALELIETLSS
jgi:neutral ceramidase